MVAGTYTLNDVQYPIDLDYTRGIQKTLGEKLVQSITADGNFGPVSIAALKQYQLANGLPATGVYDAASQALIEPYLLSKFVTYPYLQQAATSLGVSVAAVKAVQETETAGSGFLYTGKPVILFERHWFYRLLQPTLSTAQFQALVAANSDIINQTPGGYVGGVGEWPRLSRAIAINPTVALMSASWGLFQIMGFNANICGYVLEDGKTADVASFVDDMNVSEMKHLSAFIVFNQRYNGGALQTAMKMSDWTSYAKVYNGPANVAAYSSKLISNYTAFQNYK